MIVKALRPLKEWTVLLHAAYARAMRVRTLASVMGEQGLPEADRKFLLDTGAKATRAFLQSWEARMDARSE